MENITVQSKIQLEELKRPQLLELMKNFKAEDTDCLQEVNGRSKNNELVEALAEYMGFNNSDSEEQAVTMEVNKEIAESVQADEGSEPVDPTAGLFIFGDDAHENPALQELADVMDFGADTPTVEIQADLFGEEAEVQVISIPEELAIIMEESGVTLEEAKDIQADILADLAEQDADWKAQVEAQQPKAESTGDEAVDNLLAELGMDGLDAINVEDIQTEEQPLEVEVQAEVEEKKPKKRKATIPMDAPIPVRNYQSLILGVYGNVLEEREEPFPTGHKYEGMTYQEVKLERFNPKAHEVFRTTKGHMHLLYTEVGSTYLVVLKKSDGTIEPVIEVSNKGRGHLRCKQLANHLLVAYNEKNDQEVISATDYQKLTEQIELLPINMESVGA